MRQIPGCGNWRIRYEQKNSGIAILRAETCDAEAVLPEELLGLPVTELGDYALAARDQGTRGAKLEMIGRRTDQEAEWSNRRMRSLRLPCGIRRIGNYAFMGAFYMERFEFCDEPVEWGVSPFMNCMALHEIIVNRPGEDQGGLAKICGETDRELDVQIRDASGMRARLLFPEYAEIWEENTPARQFDHTTDGAGYPYHHVFRDRRLHWKDYDGLWEKSRERGGIEDVLTRLAWFRLRWPEGLEEQRRRAYLEYVTENRERLMRWVLENGDGTDLSRLLEIVVYTPQQLREGCDFARESGEVQSLAVLLSRLRGEQPAGRRKRFEL